LITLTPAGRALLAEAVPIWKDTHAAIEAQLTPSDPERLRQDLRRLS
jgi:DNA-binding MarR family transcriptional regulator